VDETLDKLQDLANDIAGFKARVDLAALEGLMGSLVSAYDVAASIPNKTEIGAVLAPVDAQGGVKERSDAVYAHLAQVHQQGAMPMPAFDELLGEIVKLLQGLETDRVRARREQAVRPSVVEAFLPKEFANLPIEQRITKAVEEVNKIVQERQNVFNAAQTVAAAEEVIDDLQTVADDIVDATKVDEQTLQDTQEQMTAVEVQEIKVADKKFKDLVLDIEKIVANDQKILDAERKKQEQVEALKKQQQKEQDDAQAEALRASQQLLTVVTPAGDDQKNAVQVDKQPVAQVEVKTADITAAVTGAAQTLSQWEEQAESAKDSILDATIPEEVVRLLNDVVAAFERMVGLTAEDDASARQQIANLASAAEFELESMRGDLPAATDDAFIKKRDALFKAFEDVLEISAKYSSSSLTKNGGLDMARLSSLIRSDAAVESLGKRLVAYAHDGVVLRVVSTKKVSARQVLAVFV
jgi:DNA repair exonuclease SbcCD ATPase subunit